MAPPTRDGASRWNWPVIDAAVSGFGIAYVPEDIVTSHIASGELEIVLDD